MKSRALLISRTKSGGRGRREWEGSRCSHLSGGRNHFNTVALITNETDATQEGEGSWLARSHKASTALCSVRGNFSQKRRCNQQFPRYHTTNKGNARHRVEGEAGLGNRGSEHARVDRGRRIGEVEANLRI